MRKEDMIEPIIMGIRLVSGVRRLQQKLSEALFSSIPTESNLYHIRYLDDSLDHGDTLLLL
jgi:hypothetical protein